MLFLDFFERDCVCIAFFVDLWHELKAKERMLQKIRGVVLHSLKYNDGSNIVTVYTEQHGCVSYMVSVSRSKKAGSHNAFYLPLALIEFESDYRTNVSIHRMKEVKASYVFRSLPYDPYKSAIALFLSEFLYRALREEGENVSLFSYLMYSIQWLDTCEKSCANFHLVFLMRLLRFLGLYPNLEDYYPGVCFDLRNACFTGRIPLHSDYILPEEASRLVSLMRMNYDTMHLFVMNRNERSRCLEVINDYYRLHLPDFPLLKSIDVLKALFE